MKAPRSSQWVSWAPRRMWGVDCRRVVAGIREGKEGMMKRVGNGGEA